MTRLRSVETQYVQLLSERQTSDKHNQALRAQLIKAQEKVVISALLSVYVYRGTFIVEFSVCAEKTKLWFSFRSRRWSPHCMG